MAVMTGDKHSRVAKEQGTLKAVALSILALRPRKEWNKAKETFKMPGAVVRYSRAQPPGKAP